MTDDQKILTEAARKKTVNAILLVEASLNRVSPYELNKTYSPLEAEPYDALCDRFIRAIETAIKYFVSYEKLMFAENSETLRDLLNRMEKLHLISSSEIWFKMRDVRNRIVHDYLPEKIKDMYDSIINEFGKELLKLLDIIKKNTVK